MVFILDRSGSMAGLESDTIGGFNAMIEKQKKEAGEALVSTVLFSGESTVIHDREEYLSMEREGYFTNQVFEEIYRFRQRIADADTSVFASCLYGNTCLDHLIAFARVDGEPEQDNLRINAISVVTPLWPGQAYVQVLPPTPQP